MAIIKVGCSGWEYRHWRGNFYPADLPHRRWLEHYAREFDTVELNNSFYRLPEASRFAEWRERTPAGFSFAVKASRYLTHMKKLKEPEEPLDRFFGRAASLLDKLDVVLYQLPPRWGADVERLEAFLRAAGEATEVRQAMEFRDPSWYTEEILGLLTRHGVALCLHDMAGSATGSDRQVGPFVYVRFHGAGARYGGGYPRASLRGWARWMNAQASAGLDVFAYFNNDVGGHAPRDAATLKGML